MTSPRIPLLIRVGLMTALMVAVTYPCLGQSPPRSKEEIELDKLREEVRSLQDSNADVARWIRMSSTVIGSLTGVATALLGFIVWKFGNSVQDRFTRSQDRKIEQDKELQRESHNLELFKNLANENARLQLSAAAVLLQRLESDIGNKNGGDRKLERVTIIRVLVSVLKEKRLNLIEADPMCKLIADNLVKSLGAVLPKGQEPQSSESPLKDDNWDFQHANLRNCWWKRVDVRGVDFFRAHLEDAGLAQAFLAGAVLMETSLTNTVLRGADLRNTNLHGADLRGADLTGAQLDGADLEDAIYNDKTRWPEGFHLSGSKARFEAEQLVDLS